MYFQRSAIPKIKTLLPICGERVNLFFAANSGLPPSNNHKWRFRLGFFPTTNVWQSRWRLASWVGGAVPTANCVKFLPKIFQIFPPSPPDCFSHLKWNKWCLQYTALGYSIHTTLAPSGWAALPIQKEPTKHQNRQVRTIFRGIFEVLGIQLI